MSYLGWRSRRGKVKSYNNTAELCFNLGLCYPPDACQINGFIQAYKASAKINLKVGYFKEATNCYTKALQGYELCHNDPTVAIKRHKLLCKRSSAYLGMKKFKESRRDAAQAVDLCPSDIKGYWRYSEAVKGGYHGVQLAMPYLTEGLRRALDVNTVKQNDVVKFITEICALIPEAPRTEKMRRILYDMCIPDEKDVQIWYKVIANLAAGRHWKGLGM
ncbi:hypothetical protein MAR_013289, partial [Mya arenaria]